MTVELESTVYCIRLSVSVWGGTGGDTLVTGVVGEAE